MVSHPETDSDSPIGSDRGRGRDIEGFASEAEVDAGAEVFSGGPDHAPLPSDSRVPPGASSSASPARAPLFYSSTSASQGPMSGV